MAGRQTLVVDALNYLGFFFPSFRQTRNPWAELAIGARHVRGFLEAAEEAGLTPKFVVDCGWASDEAGSKWRGRRKREVWSEDRGMFAGADTLLIDLLHAHGADVYTPEELDADDVVALLAHDAGPGSLILSADRDMFRYGLPNATRRVMSSFLLEEVLRGSTPVHRLLLFPSLNPTTRPGVPARSIESLQASIFWDPEAWRTRTSKLPNAASPAGLAYIRGTCSSFVRRCGNLHGHLAPLRAAVYHWTGRAAPVREVYPEWDGVVGEVRWVEGDATPGTDGLPPDLAALGEGGASPLELGRAALQWLEGVDPAASDPELADNAERSYARAFLVSEIVFCVGDTGTDIAGTLQAISGRTIAEGGPRWPPRDWAASKRNIAKATGRGRSPASAAVPHERAEVGAEAVCTEPHCQQPFAISASELRWFESKGFSVPRRCKPCRTARRNAAGR
eukprot:jgi/Tetstr1/446283/TSEL_033827.t1